jgi:hypothetical protein
MTMNDAYTFVKDAELRDIEANNQILTSMLKLTVECGYFIRSYATRSSGILAPPLPKLISSSLAVLRNAFSQADTAILEYMKQFDALKTAIRDQAVLHTEITVLRFVGEVESLGRCYDFFFFS